MFLFLCRWALLLFCACLFVRGQPWEVGIYGKPILGVLWTENSSFPILFKHSFLQVAQIPGHMELEQQASEQMSGSVLVSHVLSRTRASNLQTTNPKQQRFTLSLVLPMLQIPVFFFLFCYLRMSCQAFANKKEDVLSSLCKQKGYLPGKSFLCSLFFARLAEEDGNPFAFRKKRRKTTIYQKTKNAAACQALSGQGASYLRLASRSCLWRWCGSWSGDCWWWAGPGRRAEKQWGHVAWDRCVHFFPAYLFCSPAGMFFLVFLPIFSPWR